MSDESGYTDAATEIPTPDIHLLELEVGNDEHTVSIVISFPAGHGLLAVQSIQALARPTGLLGMLEQLADEPDVQARINTMHPGEVANSLDEDGFDPVQAFEAAAGISETPAEESAREGLNGFKP